MDREGLYAKLPVAAQQLATSLEGWRIHRRRYNAAFHHLLDEYLKRSFWSRDEIRAYRDQRLAAFIEHAARTVPYYRDLFRRLGATPHDFRTMEDLRALPILTKETVQEQAERFVSEAVPLSTVMTCHTSGTTGAGLRFPATHDSQREHWAVWWRYRLWHGIRFGTPCLYFGGRSIVPLSQQRPPFWRTNRPGNQVLFSGYHLSPANAPAYLDALRQFGAVWIHGYPSLLSLLAGFALERGVHFNARWVTLGAENVLPQQAEVIERAFGVQPLSHYSMAEGVANISQCPNGNFHVDEDFAATEFIPIEGGGARIVGTNLSNPAFPLLRYDAGDIAALDDTACACGRPGRIVRRVDGRKEDYIITKSGARLGRLDHIFKDMVHVREAQIRQHRQGAIELCIVKTPEYTEADERALRDETHKRVGDDMELAITYLERLPRTAAGKLRFVVSTLEEGRLDAP